MRNVRVVRLSVVRALLAVSLVALAGPLCGTPSNVSVTPSSGTGSSQTFSYVFSDPNGFTDIVSAQMLVGPFSAANSCYMYFERSTNRLWLVDDSGTGHATGSPVTLSVAGSLQNSQCTVDALLSSSSGAGNNLTVNLALTFKPALAGAQGNDMTAWDGTNSSPWESKGTWIVPGYQPPTNVSVTAASLNKTSQSSATCFPTRTDSQISFQRRCWWAPSAQPIVATRTSSGRPTGCGWRTMRGPLGWGR